MKLFGPLYERTLVWARHRRAPALLTGLSFAEAVVFPVPPEVMLYTLYARACDPVLGLLKVSGNYSDQQIIEMLLSTCFDGLVGRESKGLP